MCIRDSCSGTRGSKASAKPSHAERSVTGGSSCEGPGAAAAAGGSASMPDTRPARRAPWPYSAWKALHVSMCAMHSASLLSSNCTQHNGQRSLCIVALFSMSWWRRRRQPATAGAHEARALRAPTREETASLGHVCTWRDQCSHGRINSLRLGGRVNCDTNKGLYQLSFESRTTAIDGLRTPCTSEGSPRVKSGTTRSVVSNSGLVTNSLSDSRGLVSIVTPLRGCRTRHSLFEHDGDGRPVVQADAIRAPLDSSRG